MNNLKISFVDSLSFDIEDKMEKGLKEYETSHGIEVNYKPFALILYGENNEVIGVLDAFSSYSSIHIRNIWVDKSHRGNGYGKKLIAELENYFKGQGFSNINLITCAFQAPDFYKKCGFSVEFVRKNVKNPALDMTFFVKYFENEL